MQRDLPPADTEGGSLRWLLAVTCLLAVVLLLLWRPSSGTESAQAAGAGPASHVIGNLGGVPVAIPRHLVRNLEYDEDPAPWGPPRRAASQPRRSYDSRIASFGYYVQFPEMLGEATPELALDRRRSSPASTRWIRVGVNTGKYYPGDGFLERRLQAELERPNGLEHEQYAELPRRFHGLIVYAPAGIDPRSGAPYREDMHAEDIFVSRDADGRIDAHIRCSNRNVPAPPCLHDFSLEPHKSVKVYVKYRRQRLPEWREIQTAVTRHIEGFTLPERPAAAASR